MGGGVISGTEWEGNGIKVSKSCDAQGCFYHSDSVGQKIEIDPVSQDSLPFIFSFLKL